jgi:hypothetical protein
MTITITNTEYRETVATNQVKPLTAHTCRYAGETYIVVEDLENPPREIHLVDPRDIDLL